MKRTFSLKESFYLFGVLCILFLPAPLHLFGAHPHLSFIWEKPLQLFSVLLTGEKSAEAAAGSDSKALYLLALLLLIIAIVVSLVLTLIRNWDRIRFLRVAQFLINFYLSLVLVRYGFDKIFKAQFYLPEPNILYTPLGQLDKDILYWSTLGTSYGYNLFLGSMEVIAGFLLLWWRTRLPGLIMSILIFVNVVAVNIFFDISVKLYSGFLLFLSVLLLLPWIKPMGNFFSGSAVAASRPEPLLFPGLTHFRVALTTFCVLLVIAEGVYPAIRTVNFNDDEMSRPYLHGVYENSKDSGTSIKRIFIHRDGWIIFQNGDDIVEDQRLRIDSTSKKFFVEMSGHRWKAISYTYNVNDSVLALQTGTDTAFTCFKAKDWRKLPLLRDQFHWTVD